MCNLYIPTNQDVLSAIGLDASDVLHVCTWYPKLEHAGHTFAPAEVLTKNFEEPYLALIRCICPPVEQDGGIYPEHFARLELAERLFDANQSTKGTLSDDIHYLLEGRW
jgi:hypothetical protein